MQRWQRVPRGTFPRARRASPCTRLDLPGPGDELSGVVAAAVGLPAAAPLVAPVPTSPDASSSSSALSVSSTVFLTRFFMSLRSDSSSTDTMFADTAPLANDLLFCRKQSYDGTRAVFRYAIVNLRKKSCVTIALLMVVNPCYQLSRLRNGRLHGCSLSCVLRLFSFYVPDDRCR